MKILATIGVFLFAALMLAGFATSCAYRPPAPIVFRTKLKSEAQNMAKSLRGKGCNVYAGKCGAEWAVFDKGAFNNSEGDA